MIIINNDDLQGRTVRMDPSPGFETSIGFLLSQLGVAAKRSWMDLLARHEFTPHQYAVLLMLRQFRSLGLTELARAAFVDPRNMGPILDPLETRRLIAREDHPTDRRRRTLALTRVGERVAAELAAAAASIEDDFLQPLDAHDREQLRTLLLTLWNSTPRGKASEPPRAAR
jgi:DNA-binding MarR family transcriptional regulator